MTSMEANHPHSIEWREDDDLRLHIVRAEARLDTLRDEQRRRTPIVAGPAAGVFPESERIRIDREFDQRTAYDAADPGRDYME